MHTHRTFSEKVKIDLKNVLFYTLLVVVFKLTIHISFFLPGEKQVPNATVCLCLQLYLSG